MMCYLIREKERRTVKFMKKTKKRLLYGAAVVFWLVVWQLAAMAIGQEVFLVSPIQALGTLLELLPQPEFWQRIGFSAGRILLGFLLGAVSSVVLAVAAEGWAWVEALLSPVMQLVKATPVASFIILALVWVSGSSLSILISFFMVLPVLYGAVRTGIESTDGQLLEMARVFRLPLPCRVKAIWLPAVLPAFRQGCSVALGICWKSGVAAEVIGLPDGSIGDALYRAKITLSTGELFAWTFVIIVLSAAFEKLFLALLDKAVARAAGEEGCRKDALRRSEPDRHRPGDPLGTERLGQDHPAPHPDGAGSAYLRHCLRRWQGGGCLSGGPSLPPVERRPERRTGAAGGKRTIQRAN